MKKSKAGLAAALLIAASASLPARADDTNEMLKNTAMFPVTAVAIGSAMVVGTPIAVTRQVSVRIREYTATFADNIGGKEHFPPNLFASVLSVPFGAIVGTAEGVYYGPKNAIQHGVEKPFSVASFSLADMD